MFSNATNFGNGSSPSPILMTLAMKLKTASSNGDFDSVTKLTNLSLLTAAASVGNPLSSQKGNHGFIG